MINCVGVARRGRYPSDTSEEQWALIEPLLPEVKTGGRPEKYRARISEEEKLMELLRRAHAEHEAHTVG